MSAAVRWAFVLAAGYGTRLRPLTACRAKVALPVARVPLIRRVLEWLGRSGISEVVLNLHHRPETVTAAVGDGSDLGLRVRYSWEVNLLGTAGGVRHALPLIEAPRFFVVNGDTLTDAPLQRIVEQHVASGALVTLAVVPHPDPRRYGSVLADAVGRVVGFSRPGGGGAGGWHFIGVQLVEAEAFSTLREGERADTIAEFYERLARTRPGAVRVCPVTARFLEVGTPRDYLNACLAVAQDEGLGAAGVVEPGARVDPSARLLRTVVWAGATIGPACELVDCIVGDGVVLPPGTRCHSQVLVAERRCERPAEATSVAPDVVAVPLERPPGSRPQDGLI